MSTGPAGFLKIVDDGDKHVGQRAVIVRRVCRFLRQRDVSGLRDEPLEIRVGDGEAVHPEAVDAHPMRRRLFRVGAVRAHQELAAGNPDHIRGGRLIVRRTGSGSPGVRATTFVGIGQRYHSLPLFRDSDGVNRSLAGGSSCPKATSIPDIPSAQTIARQEWFCVPFRCYSYVTCQLTAASAACHPWLPDRVPIAGRQHFLAPQGRPS